MRGFLALQDTLYRNVKLAQDAVDVLSRHSEEHGLGLGGIQELRRMLNRTVDPRRGNKKTNDMDADEMKEAREFFSYALSLSPESVKKLLDMWLDLKRRSRVLHADGEKGLKEMLGKEIVLRKPAPHEEFLESIADQLIAHCENKMLANPLTESQRDHIRLQVIESVQVNEALDTRGLDETGWRVKTERILREHGERGSLLDVSLINVGLYLFGMIAWPHSSFVRYPAAPGAPSSFKEAAKNPDRGRLGAGHYSDEVGAIKCIKDLTPKAVDLTKMLKQAWKAGYMVPADPYAKS